MSCFSGHRIRQCIVRKDADKSRFESSKVSFRKSQTGLAVAPALFSATSRRGHDRNSAGLSLQQHKTKSLGISVARCNARQAQDAGAIHLFLDAVARKTTMEFHRYMELSGQLLKLFQQRSRTYHN